MEDEDLTEEQIQRFTDRLLIQVPRDHEADNTKPAMSQVQKAFSDIIQEVDRKLLEENAEKAIQDFQDNPTYDTFYKMCDLVRQSDDWQCGEALEDVADKIPVSELEKILAFMATEGRKEKWREGCEISMCGIINCQSWINMSAERMEVLRPYMDGSFWEHASEYGCLLAPKEMSSETFRMVMNAILSKPE
uniref:Uncharacterized protein n=1 Tax=Pithovirus LCPAC304 TaxID=2506594 RepID=A0A481Z880_9VIRU|nr:MAG: hypothetical protein LCPAC304_04310 [Pithovirus LCPAC304]